MVKSTIDDIKDITLERQIRKLADVIDEQNKKIDATVDYSTDIDNLKASDANQTIQINNLKQTVATDKLATDSAITALQNKDTEQDGILTEHTTLIQNIKESLVSAVQIMPGTTTGDIKVRLERESAAAIDSNNYNLGLPVSAEVIQGTGPSMFKIQITMSSGVKVVSNDFVFTTEAIGTDVYISSFTFKAGNQSGYLSADIGLNNGVVIEANNFLVPTDPNVTSAITDLQNRVSTIESTGVAGINELKTTVDGHTTSINELNTEVGNLTSDVAGLTTDKADVNNSNQTITAGTINATNINKNGVGVATTNDIPDISGKVNIAQGTENAGKVLGIGVDGNVTPVEGSSGGEVWEEIDLNNWPTDWVTGDRVKIFPQCTLSTNDNSWTTKPTSVHFNNVGTYRTQAIEIVIPDAQKYCAIPVTLQTGTNSILFSYIISISDYSYWNKTNVTLFTVEACSFNAGGKITSQKNISPTSNKEFIYKMWRCRTST